MSILNHIGSTVPHSATDRDAVGAGVEGRPPNRRGRAGIPPNCYSERCAPLRRGDYACPREVTVEKSSTFAAPASTSFSQLGSVKNRARGCVPGYQGPPTIGSAANN